MNNPSSTAIPKLWSSSLWLASIASFLMFTAFYMLMPIIAMYVVEQFHASASMAGVVVSSYIISALLARPFSGYIVDTFDRKKIYAISYFAFMVLVYSYTLASSVAGLILVRVLLGATFSVVTTAANTVAIDLMPPERRGEGIGYVGAITVLAMAMGPMTGLYLIEAFSYNGLFIFAGSSCLLGLICVSQVKTKYHAPKEHAAITLDRFFLKEAAPLAAVISMMNFPIGILMAYIPLFIQENNISTPSGNFFLYYAIGVVISRAISGKLLNKGLHNTLLTIGMGGGVSSLIIFVFFLTPTTFIISSLALGLCYGMISPSTQSMVVDMVPHTRRGTANSTFFIALDIGSGTGMLIGGAVASAYSYKALFAIATTVLLIDFVLYKTILYRKYRANCDKLSEINN